MKNITTYSASRKNPLVWLAALLMLASAVARIVYYSRAEAVGVLVVVVRIILPLAANLFIAVRLPSKGAKMFYVTVGPVVLLAVYFVVCISTMKLSAAMTIACLFFCILEAVLYVFTYTGRIPSSLPVLFSYLIPIVFMCIDGWFAHYFERVWTSTPEYFIMDAAAVLGIICCILAGRKLPAPKEGDPYRLRYGDRPEGRLIRTLYPMAKVAPYIMVNRNGASNFIRDSVEVSAMEKYIHKKRREGCKHFGITHVFLAAYVRACAEFPQLNRFLAGQKVYHRFDIDVCMAIKKEMSAEGTETVIKVKFDPADTATDVYEKYDAVLQSVRTPELDSDFDGLAGLFDLIPGLFLKFAVWLLKALDYLGWMPEIVSKLSPFHGSMFITSMGSLGIPPIYHHLYDFGNLPQFCAFGAKRTVREINSAGEVETKKYVDYTWVCDERILDGYNYAQVLKRMRSLMLHPEQLDVPPEKVLEDIE